MKKIIGLLAAAFIAFCGCEKDNPTGTDPGEDDAPVKISIAAVREHFLWSEDDAISVFDGNGNNVKFTLSDGAGKSTASFTGIISSVPSNYIAFYPYRSGVGSDSSEGLLSGVELKSEQKAVIDGIDSEVAMMTAVRAKVNDTFKFRDVVGYVRVVPEFDCSRISLVSDVATDALAGLLYSVSA